MALKAIASRSLSDAVFDQLVSEIITGGYSAGDTLPAERSLAETFQVNRHVVREALKRLEQIGLVKIAQGGGTKVLNFERSGGLDLLALLGDHVTDAESAATFWLSVLEMRAAIAADVARLCAERADITIRDQLIDLSTEMQKTGGGRALFLMDLRFWELIVDGSHNLPYRLAYNSLVSSTSEAINDFAFEWLVDEIVADDFRRPLAAAIAVGDSERAESITRENMRAAIARLQDALAAMSQLSNPSASRKVAGAKSARS